MNNNNLDQISMRSSKRSKERFNLKHGVDTSFGIGEMQPLLCKKCIAHSKNVIKVNNVVRLAPMVAPTFGQLKLHHNFAFVGMSDLFDSQVWNAFLANQPVEFAAGNTQVPSRLPLMSIQLLSAFALVGAKCSVYFDQSSDDTGNSMETRIDNFVYEPGTTPASGFANYFEFENNVALAQHFYPLFGMDQAGDTNKLFRGSFSGNEHYGYAFKDYNSSRLNFGRIFGFSNDFWLPSANWGVRSFGYYNGVGSTSGDPDYTKNPYYQPLYDMDYVPLESADVVIQGVELSNSSTTVYATFAFRLSDFGKRWRKLLIGLGYGFDLSSTKSKSLSKLFATYMAYFNMFGLTLYQNWETTSCAKVLQAFNTSYVYDYSQLFASGSATGLAQTYRRNLLQFFADLADMWYTEEQDWISAHIRSAAVSPNDGVPTYFGQQNTPNVNHPGLNVGDAIKDVEPTSLVSTYDSSSGSGNGHAFINAVLHSQLDSEVLKRLYKLTNRNTIAGRRIAELLKAQGLGEYMKRQRSNFVGHSSVNIEIFDVTATADTYDITNSGGSQKGSVLGEYVGKGVGEGSSKRFTFSSPEEGFFIDLAAIVPESGWMNGADLECEDVKKLDFYNPEYDGLGFEMSPKSIVCADVPWVYNGASSVHDLGFGFIPRYTRHKVTQDVCNGDVSLRSTRDGFLPYTLGKFVDLGSRDVQDVTPNTNIPATFHGYKVSKMLTPDRLPIATINYRYLGKFPWMGHFYRIFANIQRDRVANQGEYYQNFSSSTMDSTEAWFLLRTDDNFIVHSVFLQDYYAGMLAIEDSFETHEDGNNGASDMSIGKA